MELRFRGIVGNEDQPRNIGIRDIRIRPHGDGAVATVMSGRDGGLTALQLGEGRGAQVLDERAFSPLMGAMSGDIFMTRAADGTDIVITGTDAGGTMHGYAFSAETGFGQQVRLAGLAGADPSGGGAVLAASGRLYVADGAGAAIHCLGADGQGGYRREGTHEAPDAGAGGAAILATAEAGGREFLLALRGGSGGLASYAVAPDGGLAVCAGIGPQEGLGLLGHGAGMEVVTLGAQTYVIVATAAGGGQGGGQGGALSVMELSPGGALVPTDHILDNRDTRFGTVQDIATVTHGDQVLVVAGGGDDGLSIFILVPGGQLVHLQSLPHDTGLGLQNVASIAAAVLGDELQVLVASQNGPGVAQFAVSLDGRGKVLQARDGGAALRGGSGHDVIAGGAGADRLHGGRGDDIILGGAGSDTLTGGAGADLFVLGGGGASDRITDFDPRSDRLDLSGFHMLYDAGALVIESRGKGVRITWRDEHIDLTGAKGAALNLDAVRAAITLGADRPPMVVDRETPGTARADTLEGFWGRDTLLGFSGADLLQGQAGNDRLVGHRGYDTLIGGAGDDTVLGGNGRDRAELGDGDDVYFDTRQGGRHGADTVLGGAGDDRIRGGGGADMLSGGPGDDRLLGGAGPDRMRGEAGNDTLLGQSQADRMTGGAGDDVLHGHGGADTLIGGTGDDTLIGGFHDDALWGGAGDDLVLGGMGRDRIDMGAGDDLFRDMKEGGRDGSDTVLGGDGNDTFQGGGGGDLLVGQAGDDLIFGRRGDDTLFGGAGADTIVGGSGADRVAGGNGRDRVFLNGGDDLWTDTGQSGRRGGDFVHGGHGDDTLRAGGGDDTLFGGAGADTFVFAPGTDRDRVADFQAGLDTLALDDALWRGNLSAAEVVSRFATRRGEDVILDFGEDEIWLGGIADPGALAGDIEIF